MPLKSKNKGKIARAWRPNFRNVEALPDIKVVRTGFLLNLVTISIAIILVGVAVYREYRIASISRALDGLEENIASSLAADRIHVRMSNDFTRDRNVVAQLVDFQNVPVDVAEMLFAVVAAQPPEVTLESLNFGPQVTRQGRRETVTYHLVMNGSVLDVPEGSASAIITDFQNQFAEVEPFAPFHQNTTLSGFTRNELLSSYSFTIRVVLVIEAPPAPQP